jgi:AcrR family transcriptional regulator
VNRIRKPSDHEEEPATTARPSATPPARLRRDAERNRQRILAAAAEVFTERGLEATLDDVARHAGVGVGTVYRRFPDKASLADALFNERVDALAEMAERAQAQPDAWAALVWFIENSAEMLASDRGLRQLLMFAAQGHDQVTYARDRMRPAVERLVRRAQADGLVRPDLAPTDVPIIEFMIGSVAEYVRQVRPTVWRRYLTLMLDGLRPACTSGTPLPEPGLTPDEMLEIVNSNPLSQHLASHKTATTATRRPPRLLPARRTRSPESDRSDQSELRAVRCAPNSLSSLRSTFSVAGPSR